MGLAIQLYFDSRAEQTIRHLRAALAEHGVPPVLDTLDDRPHISLAVLPGNDPMPLLPYVAELAQAVSAFPIALSALGIFPTTEGVLYLAPTPNMELLAAHRTLHQILAATAFERNAYYLPEQWVPHCSIALELRPAQIAAAVEICLQEFSPLTATCREVGLITFRPVKAIETYPLRDRGA